jgi:dipeptidyl aminopeptidase/acylaminoacyl peptidase
VVVGEGEWPRRLRRQRLLLSRWRPIVGLTALASIVATGSAAYSAARAALAIAYVPPADSIISPRAAALPTLERARLLTWSPRTPVTDAHFLSHDGLSISGWYIQQAHRAPAIILCHPWRHDCTYFARLAEHLYRRGYHVLLFDFRAHGRSGGRYTTGGDLESRDVIAALAFLQRQPYVIPQRIGVLGYSMGAAAALLAAAYRPEIAAVIADSSYAQLDTVLAAWIQGYFARQGFGPVAKTLAQWALRGFERYASCSLHVSPAAAAHQIVASGRHVMIVHGLSDTLVDPAHARAIAARATGDSLTLWLVDGAEHCGASDYDLRTYLKRVDAFFDSHLRPDATGEWFPSAPLLDNPRRFIPRPPETR